MRVCDRVLVVVSGDVKLQQNLNVGPRMSPPSTAARAATPGPAIAIRLSLHPSTQRDADLDARRWVARGLAVAAALARDLVEP